jgi:acylaminoacyl-peptidase
VQAPAAEKTPEWGNEGAPKDVAAPKGWRGQAAFVDDWGELNTGKKPPSLFLLDLDKASVSQVRTLACLLAHPVAR